MRCLYKGMVLIRADTALMTPELSAGLDYLNTPN